MTNEMGLSARWALDLVEVDPHEGMPWDFSKQDKRAKVFKIVQEDKRFMLISSPTCAPLSALQSLFNYPRQNDGYVKHKLQDAISHAKVCLELCLEQYAIGKLSLFEHPAGAASWSMRAMREMKLLEGVRAVKFYACMLGMKT